jgi:hypothetical protein
MTRNPYCDSAACRAHVRELSGGTCILSFSRGKDSLAAWLVLRAEGWTVKPFTLNWIPGGLRIENEATAYYEREMGTPILRLTHPFFYQMLDDCVYQPPERWAALDEIGVPYLDMTDIDRIARAELGDHWIAMGTRAVDSHRRRTAIERHGPANHKRRLAQVIYDMRIEALSELIRASGAKLPPDYRLFGRSFDGLYWRYLAPLREHYPDDWERVLEWFPLAWTQFERESERVRHEAA